MFDDPTLDPQHVAIFPAPPEAPEGDHITQALADLDRAREACLTAMEAAHAFPSDRVRAASELRLINRERIALVQRQQTIRQQANGWIEPRSW